MVARRWKRTLTALGLTAMFGLGAVAVVPSLLKAESPVSKGDPAPSATTTVQPDLQWLKIADNQLQLRVRLEGKLTSQQKDLINSGFSTFSRIAVYDEAAYEKLQQARSRKELIPGALQEVACSTKFDTWEERYEVVRLEKDVKSGQAKEFSAFANLCLTINLQSSAPATGRSSFDIQSLAREGGTLRAVLIMDQIAAEQAAQIKDWLVKQQSGIIQGLFSHMLGDFKLSEREEIVLKVPAAGRVLGQTGRTGH